MGGYTAVFIRSIVDLAACLPMIAFDKSAM